MDNIYSAYHYACKTKKDREAIEALKPQIDDAVQKAVWGNIGDIKYTTRTTVPNGGYWCDGQTISKSELESVYQMLVDGKLQSVDITTYNSVVTTNGSCGFFGLDTENETFKVPTLTDVYIKSGQAAQTFGAESLPNITGSWSPNGVDGTTTATGAFSVTSRSANGAGHSGATTYGFNFDASRSSSVYKSGAKVNPDNVKYRAYVILYTAVKEFNIADYTSRLENTTQIGVSTVAAKTQEGVNTLNSKTLSGMSDLANASNALRTTQITNCITEIPQDVKIELSNGMPTLKKGSRVYTPNGAGVFDTVVIANDITSAQTLWGAGKYFVVVSGGQYVNHIAVSSVSSGPTQPTPSSGYWWYDTENNKLKASDGTSWMDRDVSLPIALVTSTDGASVSSIDQVFNGFGYIGSTIFALPGVKGLIPDGRNADGSLRNVEFITSSVGVRSTGLTNDNLSYALGVDGTPIDYRKLVISEDEPSTTYTAWYKPSENILYTTGNNSPVQIKRCVCIDCYRTSSAVSYFTPKLPFRAVDYNDKAEVISWMMPNYGARVSRTKDVKYTAEVSGYLIGYDLLDRTNGATAYIYINNINVRINSAQDDYAKNTWCYPILKGSSYYFAGTSTMGMYFVPCIGG